MPQHLATFNKILFSKAVFRVKCTEIVFIFGRGSDFPVDYLLPIPLPRQRIRRLDVRSGL